MAPMDVSRITFCAIFVNGIEKIGWSAKCVIGEPSWLTSRLQGILIEVNTLAISI